MRNCIEIVTPRRSPRNAIISLYVQGIPHLPYGCAVYFHIRHGGVGIFPSQLPYKPSFKPSLKSPPAESPAPNLMHNTIL